MAGNTGKMTNEAIAARGARIELLRIADSFVIASADAPPFRTVTERYNRRIYATSYDKRYLLRIGRSQ